MRRPRQLRKRYGHAPYRRDPNYHPMPAWVNAIENDCLRELTREAIDALSWAIDRGAERHKNAAKLLRVGNEKLEVVKEGRLDLGGLSRAAAVALRKFNQAGEQATPTATRSS
jgi:hypothetical protein